MTDLEIVELSVRRAAMSGSVARPDVAALLTSIADNIATFSRERLEREHNARVYGVNLTNTELEELEQLHSSR